MATPASDQAATNQTLVGASAISTSAGTARVEPAVITARGPRRSMIRPTAMPPTAPTTWPIENASVVTTNGQPVSDTIDAFNTVNA